MKYSKKVFMVASSLYAIGVLSGGFAYAGGLPSGGQVVDGGASISQSGDTLNIDQSTDKAVIDWNSFSVGKGNTVNFNQPASDSATLNRVTGDFTSEIAGQINANGSVFLINPNGIMITKDGGIDTGNFVASTLDIDNNDFMKGDYTFTKSGQNGVVDNRGSIAVDDGGFVALLGGAVKSNGTVRAHVGKVGFAGGEKIVMSFGNNDFLRVEVPTDKWDKLTDSQGNKVLTTVDLGGTIESRGGFIDIAVADAADILRQSISISGVVSANTVSSTDGVISISGGSLGVYGKITADAEYGSAGTINVDVDSIDGNGQFSAAAQNGTGGTIKVSLQQGADLTDGTSFDVSGRTAGGTLSFIGGLSGKGGSKILGSIDFKADSTDGKGGYIDISNKGGLVGLFSGTISASGKTQGGRIRLGGAFQGGGYDPKTSQLDKKTQDLFVTRWSDNSSLVSANKTSLGSGVNVVVSSASGTGGTAILWADNTTNNYAAIDATGATGGGAVEISGKKEVDSFGLARVKAGNGVILLDPKNVDIKTTAAGSWGDSVSQVKTIAAGSNGKFGTSVALSGNGKRMAIGDTNVDNYKGAVYIYDVNTDNSGKWGATVTNTHTIKHGTKIGTVRSTGADGNYKSMDLKSYQDSNDGVYFGFSVALNDDGSKLAVGAALGGSQDAGMVYLFGLAAAPDPISGKVATRYKRIQGGVGNAGGDIISMDLHRGQVTDPRFGRAVSLSGDGSKLAVGSAYDNSGGSGGAVYVFSLHKSGSGWGYIGSKLSTQGDTIGSNDVVYRRLAVSDLKAIDANHFKDLRFFGDALSFDQSGDRLAVGDHYYDGSGSDRGAVFLFSIKYGASRLPVPKYVAKAASGDAVEIFASGIDNANFGGGIALNKDGSRLAVGAWGESSKKGAVYLYNISGWKTFDGYLASGSGIAGNGKATITLVKKITGSSSGGYFGRAVALDKTGEKLVVGAPGSLSDKGNVELIDLTPPSPQDDSVDIETQLNNGTSVKIVASNDITVDANIYASGGGNLQLIAGRSVIINQSITVGGKLDIIANNETDVTGGYKGADGKGDGKLTVSQRAVGKAQITVAGDKVLQAGKDLVIKMLRGTQVSGAQADKKATGKISVYKVKGERVSIAYAGTTNANSDSEIIIRNGGQVEATKSPSSAEVVLELKADKFTNQADGSALKTANKEEARYLVWTKTPNDNTMGGISDYEFVQFNQSHSGTNWDATGVLSNKQDGFIYTANPGNGMQVTAKVKTKVYDGNSSAPAVSGDNLKFVSNTYGGLSFKVGAVPSSGSDKHKKFFVTNAASLAGKFYKNGAEQKDADTGLTLRYSNANTLVFKDGNDKTVYGVSAAYQDATGASITAKSLQLKIDDFDVTDRDYEPGEVYAPVSIRSGRKGFDDRDLAVGDSGVTLKISNGAFVYNDDQDGSNKPILIGDTGKFVLNSQNYKLRHGDGDLRQGMSTGLEGNIDAISSGDGSADLSPERSGSSGGGGGGGGAGAGIALLGAGAVAVMNSGILATGAAAAAAAGAAAVGTAGGTGAAAGAAGGAGAAGAGAGGASGTLGAPLGSIDTIFNSGVYAHLNGIDMQALYQPSTQTPVSSVFNAQQGTYKTKYKSQIHRTYDMALLANNIKAQKVVPLYELDEKMYETLRRIFVYSGKTNDAPA